MKDSFAPTLRDACFGLLAATALFCLPTHWAAAQSSKPDPDVPAIYYFPEAQPGNPSAQDASRPQVNGQVGNVAQQPGNYGPGSPAATAGGYSSGSPDATDQPPIAFDTNAFCAAPDASGKPRSEAWIKNCIAAAEVGPNAPARKAREEVLMQQQQGATDSQ